MKINNNKFAKGFRDNGQSRCKRKFQAEAERLSRINDEDETVFPESESNIRASNHLDVANQRPRTASSETGSLDDSGISSCGGVSPPLLLSGNRNSPMSKDVDREAQPRLHRPWVDSSPQFSSPMISSTSSFNLSPRFYDLNFPMYYFSLFYPSLMMNPDSRSYRTNG